MINAAVSHRVLGLLMVLFTTCVPRAATAATFSLTLGASTVEYVEQGNGTFVDEGLRIKDGDNTFDIVSASVTLTTPDSNDMLQYGRQVSNGVSAAPYLYESSTGLMTISGTVNSNAYEIWLTNIFFTNMNDRPKAGTRTVVFEVCRAADDCLTATKTIVVTPVNDKPMLTLSSALFSYTEMTGKQYVDATLTVTDPDTDTLSKASVQISGGYDSGKDVLSCENDPATLSVGGTSYGLSQSWNATTGTLTVSTSGTAPLSVWETILREVQYENPSQHPASETRTFTFKAYDGSDWSDEETRQMTFITINEKPVIALSQTLRTYNEQDAPASVIYMDVDTGLTVTDVDTSQMVNATVKVAVGHEANKDFLRFTNTSTITGSFDAATGILTLTGVSNRADYQAALRTVQYYNAAANAAAGTRQIEFHVTDSEGKTSDAVFVDVTFVIENDAPVMEIVTTTVEWIHSSFILQPTLNLTDKDHVTLANATVTLVQGQGFDSLVDTLTATKTAGVHDMIEVSYDNDLGRLLLSGPGSPAAYQSLLRTVRLEQTGATTTSRVISFEVKDLDGASSGLSQRRYFNSDYLPKATITSITAVGTVGGRITISGTGFGPVSPNLIDLIGLASRTGFQYCANVVVTVEDQTLECDAPPGSGRDLGAFVQVASKYSINFNLFSYIAPTVTSITSVGTLGGTATITGTNFGLAGTDGLTQAANGDRGVFGVTIGGRECADALVTDTTGTQISCTVAEFVGKDLDVTVCVRRQCYTATGAFDYVPPTITGTFSASVFGYFAYITGTNFGPVGTHSYLTVTFQATNGGNSFTCSSTEVTLKSTQIKCMVPAMQAVAAANTNDPSKTYTVTLNVGNQQFEGDQMFTYEKPVITSVTTTSLYGGQVTVQGRNFGAAGGLVPTLQIRDPANSRTYDVGAINTPTDQAPPAVTALHTTATTWVPSYTTNDLATMTPELYITIGTFTSAAAFTGFTYEGPIITGMVTPGGGSQFGDCITATNAVPCTETITISGRNFGPISLMGGNFSTWWAATHDNGRKDVTETRNEFPKFGETYARIEIDGKLPCANADCSTRNNYGLEVESNTGTSIQTIVVHSATRITFTRTAARPESHLTGEGLEIKLHLYCHGEILSTCQDSGTTGAGAFNYLGPDITGFDASVAPTSAGGLITIAGTRFGAPYAANSGFFDTTTHSAAGVKICSRSNPSNCEELVQCTDSTVVSDTQVTCVVSAATLTTGISMKTLINVTLGTKHSGTTGAGRFTYGRPTVGAGTTAPAVGGVRVTIDGTGFGPAGYDDKVKVFVGPLARACTDVVVVSHTRLTCIQNPGTGTLLDVNVTVFSKDGDTLETAAGNAAFSYNQPSVTSVTSCPTDGGTVGVYGENFGNVSRAGLVASDGNGVDPDSVTIGGIPMTSIFIHNDTYLEGTFAGEGPFATRPPHEVVVMIDGQSSASVRAFNFSSPTVTGILKRPAWLGSDNEGLIITGTSFGKSGTNQNQNTLAVTVSGTDIIITNCRVTVSHTQITCATACAAVCNAIEAGTTHLVYRDVEVKVGKAIEVGPGVGTILNSGTSGNGKLKLIGPVIRQVSGATSLMTNRLSFFPASDTLKVTGVNFGKMDASDGSTLEFIGVCRKNISECAPFPFVVPNNDFGDFGTPAATSVFKKSIDNTEVQTVLTERHGTGYSVMVKIAGVTSDDAENIDEKGTGTAVVGAVGNGILDFIGPFVNDVAAGHGILTDGTRGMAVMTQVSVSGERFGPTGLGNIEQVKWDNSSGCPGGCNLPNSNAIVTVLDNQLKFDIPSGVGTAAFKVVISNGISTMTSAAASFTYTLPRIIHVSDVAAGGGTLTITGTSFGPAGDTHLTDLLITDPTSGISVTCTSGTITVAHKEIECTMPAGTGTGKRLDFKIGGLPATNGTGTFSYSQPRITSVATMNTNQIIPSSDIHIDRYPSVGDAPWMVMTGTHFGPIGTKYEYVRLGSDLSGTHSITDPGYANCTKVEVTIPDTEIRCLLGDSAFGSGSGKNYDVLMKLLIGGGNNGPGAGSNTYADKLSYAIPTVTSSTSVTYFGGVTTTITGTNFGCISSSYATNKCPLPTGSDQTVSVQIGGKPCTLPNITVAHTQITCVAPEMTGGSTVPLEDMHMVITVEGQESVNAKYTYNRPLITNVSVASTFGSTVTITGTSFGPITDCSNNASCTIGQILLNNGPQSVSATNAKVTKAGTEIEFDAPANPLIDNALDLELLLSGLSTRVSGHGLFIYGGPIIDTVVGGLTSGGTTTVTGRNFGPVGRNVQRFIIRDGTAEEVCSDVKVTVEDTEITCTSAPGSGTGKDVLITISGAPEDSATLGERMFNYAPAEVTAANPNFSKGGTIVTFTGTSFGVDVTKIKVYVDDTECTSVTLVQLHSVISCTIPQGSGGSRPVRVDVDGIMGNAMPVFSYPPPEITHISATLPAKGSPPPLTIHGSNFGRLYDVSANATQSPQLESVTIGSVLCRFPKVVVDDRVLICDVPKALATVHGGEFDLSDWHHTAGGNMTIMVSLAGGQNSGLTGSNKFAFQEPTVTAIDPRSGTMGDTIRVTGTNLGDSNQAVQVYINGRLSPRVDFTSVESEFTFVLPVGTSINNEVMIKINGRSVSYSGVPALLDYLIPTLDPDGTVPPSTTRGGAVTTLRGTGFGPVGNAYLTSVLIDSVGECLNPNVTVENTELTCITAAGQGGGINTTVTVDGLTSLPTPAFSFHVPIVTGVQIQNNETFLRQGDLIYIRGSNFGTDADKIKVRIKGDNDEPGFGVVCPLTGSRLTFDTNPKETVTCVAPLMVGKDVSVIVDAAGLENINADGLNKVTYPNPAVYTASPAKTNGGVAAGMVTITGTNFGPNGTMYRQYITRVLLGSVPCTEAVVTERNNKIECAPGPGIGKGVDVVMTINNAGSGTSGAGLFNFLPPSVTRIDPPPTIGGIVTVHGENFGPAGTVANATVYTGQTCAGGTCTLIEEIGKPSAVTVVDHETITFNIPSGIGGNYNLSIRLGNQTSGVTGNGKFGYHVPVVQNVEPAIQPATLLISDTKITITGTNFGTLPSSIRVSVGGVDSDSSTIRLVNFRNPDDSVTGLSEIYVTIPFNAGSNLPVQVHVGAMSSVPSTTAVKTDVFSYNTPVISFTTPVPTQGSAVSNVSLSIHGFNFGRVGSISEVRVAGTVCKEPRVITQDTVITCQQPAGMGKDLDVAVRISPTDDTSSTSTGLKKFSYAAPVITRIDPQSAKVGSFITVRGRNFGFSQDLVRLCVIGPNNVDWCNDVNEMLDNHFLFSAKVPAGFGSDRTLRVEVKGLVGVQTTGVVFSYDRPEVSSAEDVPTAGGVLRVIGKQFGPRSSAASTPFDSVTVQDSRQRLLPCAAPRVVVDDTTVECDLPAGSGKGLQVQVSVGGQTSLWKKVFSYAAPVITNIQPAVAAAGETVTVTGLNFGVDASEIMLGMVKNMAFGGGTYDLPIDSTAASISMVASHTKFSFVIPLGAGPELTLLTSLPKYGNDTTFMRVSTSAQSGPSSSTTFSYKAPVISAISPVPTAGGVSTITGTNFGPVGSAFMNSVTMGEGASLLVCSDAKVTMSNTQATCNLGSGSGRAYKVQMVIFNQSNVDSTRFSYAVPVIDSVQPILASSGAVVTVSGKSFGVVVTDISIKLGMYDCMDVAMLANHTRLTCTVPSGEGKVPAVATVNGLPGASTVGEGNFFTFNKSGCDKTNAVNYDVNATTRNHTSCRILGCTKVDKFNYNAEVTEDDGTCEEKPVVVTMRINAAFSEYTSAKETFDDRFKTDLATNLNISQARIEILNVTAGSIVFTFRIFDDGSGGVRVADAAQKLEQLVLSNTWISGSGTDGEPPFVLLGLTVEGSSTGPIETKASEPAISITSIVGVSFGFGILVIWLFIWRRCMTVIAVRCFAPRDDKDDGLVEVQVFSNPLAQEKLPSAYEKYGKLGDLH